MNYAQDDTDDLLAKVSSGDAFARDAVFDRSQARWRRAIRLRLNQRLSSRVDPSDVVQKALLDAARKLDQFISERPLPFYPWLRQVALDRLQKVHRLFADSATRGRS